MPKKGKVNKLARMSDEERARYLQHRADMEEEARRRKRELVSKFIKNKLDKEEAYSRMNTAKLNQTWRYILRKIKCNQMSLEIQGIQSSFNFMVERKDKLLSALHQAIEIADEQHRRAFQSHTETLSHFIGIGSERLEKLQTEYDFQKNTLLESWDKDYCDITGNQDKSEFKLRLITFIQGTDFNNYKKIKDTEAATSKNDARLEHEEDMWSLRQPKQLEVELYWSRLQEVYSKYLEQHNPIMNHYNSLREKDDFYQRDIARNEILIQQATESLFFLHKEWIRGAAVVHYKCNKMNKQKDELTKRYWQLKKSSKLEISTGSERLTNMVNASQDVVESLERSKAKLSKILQMAEICRKYENKDDVLTESDVGDNKRDDSFINLDDAMIRECKEYRKMDKFFLKMNRVMVQTICLKAEKSKLQKENVQLKNYFKRYLTELALNSGGDQGRPASVNLQSDVKKIEGSTVKMNRPVTCIEGALSNAVVHEKRMKILEKRNKETGGIRSFPRLQCWMQVS